MNKLTDQIEKSIRDERKYRSKCLRWVWLFLSITVLCVGTVIALSYFNKSIKFGEPAFWLCSVISLLSLVFGTFPLSAVLDADKKIMRLNYLMRESEGVEGDRSTKVKIAQELEKIIFDIGCDNAFIEPIGIVLNLFGKKKGALNEQ